MIRIICILFLCCHSNTGISQEFIYKDIPKRIKDRSKVSCFEIEKLKLTTFRFATDLNSYLPKNPNTSGKVDYTASLQKGIDENSLVILPNFPVLINYSGLKLKSDSKVLFQKYSLLIMKSNDKEFYTALTIDNVSNVEIYFANLEGDRHRHLSKTGEWGMGVYIIHSKNIKLFKSTISKFWGDGIYIGRNNGDPSENVEISGSLLNDNRRNGISIISGNNILIKNTVISNTNGTSPEYGIDIEPNDSGDNIKKIVVKDFISYNNKRGGILIALDNLQGRIARPIDITISNYDDYYSENGIGFYFDRGYKKFFAPLEGNIVVKKVNLESIKIPIETVDSRKSKITVKFEGIKINDKTKNIRDINEFVEKINFGRNGVLK